MLIRVLLDELHRDGELTDAAGMAVTIARGAEDVAAQLSAGARWRRHLERGGHAHDLRIAAAVDSIGVVPVIERDGDVLVARAWRT
jgi:phosphosulfolactate phosphohydrolase-like enzyme